jgi:septal ring factor EnvC (AmiA/AmiB activator)
MKTQLDNETDVARKLAERLADTEAANDRLEAATNALKEELERKNKALEDFLAENEALKAELGGKNAPPAPVAAKDADVGAIHGKGSKGLDDLVAQARQLGW